MKSTLIYICSLLLCISGLQLSCTAQTSPRQWNIADEIGDGWSTERPAAVDIREDSIHALLDLINATPPRDFRALVVVRNGQLVVDEYFNSFWRTNIHDIRSAGKSVTSMLAGVAIQRGLFKTSDPVAKFFPEHADKAFAKSTMTVENLLTMSSGLASDDYVDDSPGAEGNMLMADNFLEFCLNLPMDFEPGSRYAYSSVVAFLLGVIIERQSGQKLEDFAKANLFGPLQIKEFYWQQSPEGHNTGMGNLYMQARDLAKLGQLMLDGGKWKQQQLLPEAFVAESFSKKLDISDNDPRSHGYGYMWYLAKMDVANRTLDYYFASGNGGNKIFIIPELDMVVVTLSSAYGQGYGHGRSHRILTKVVAAAVN